jgi:hypothetical protein
MTSCFVARKAHLLDSISNFKGSFFFHIRSSAIIPGTEHPSS